MTYFLTGIFFLLVLELISFIEKNKKAEFIKHFIEQNQFLAKQEKSLLLQASKQVDKSLEKNKNFQFIKNHLYRSELFFSLSLSEFILIHLLIILGILVFQIVLKLAGLKFLILFFFLESIYILFKLFTYKKSLLIDKYLPTILDIMAKVYQVEPNLYTTLVQVNKKIKNPELKTSFGEAINLASGGMSSLEALEYLANQYQSSNFDFVVSSIKLNQPVGGNLAVLFTETANMLRERSSTQRDIKTLMFQNKVSAIVASLLVPIITALMLIFSKSYQEVLMTEPVARLIYFFAFIWWLIGTIIIFRSIKIKV